MKRRNRLFTSCAYRHGDYRTGMYERRPDGDLHWHGLWPTSLRAAAPSLGTAIVKSLKRMSPDRARGLAKFVLMAGAYLDEGLMPPWDEMPTDDSEIM